jgi:hypothetical protein
LVSYDCVINRYVKELYLFDRVQCRLVKFHKYPIDALNIRINEYTVTSSPLHVRCVSIVNESKSIICTFVCLLACPSFL